MDYGKTVNLPRTSFPMKGNLPAKEPAMLEFWEKLKNSSSVGKRKNYRGKFILHDGPPYANGHIHIGTALNKILKDIVVRYFSLDGYEAPFIPGWDCHGLPIEQNVLKEVGEGSHPDGKSGVSPIEFRKKAAAYARRFVGIQKEEFRRLGVAAQWDNPYLTLEPYYEAAIVKVFGRLAAGGFIYRRKKPVYWCPSCRTALAEAEVEYAEHISDDIFVKFRVDESVKKPGWLNPDGVRPHAVIWTTTPWTLPANVALAFHPSEKYILLEIDDPRFPGGERWIIASKLKDTFIARNKISSSKVIVEEIPGSEFEGINFINPLNGNKSVGVLADFVSMEDGSGIVHIAPGHGAEDYSVGLKYSLPVLSPVDDAGAFTDEAGEFKGHKVFAANHLIVEKLSKSGALVSSGKISHSYPHCWRCKRAIIFRATEQWFLDVNSGDFKKKLQSAIDEVKWLPEYGKNRIASMTADRPDWCLSRQRLWGTPIPVFYCDSCGAAVLPDEKTINGIADLFGRYGSDIWFEKSASEIIEMSGIKDGVICPRCSSKKLRKETDIFDVWFDSGVSSFAVLESGKFPSLEAPADLYLEGSDQHRGWFQTSLIPSVALRNGKAPYKMVLTHGFVVDGEGKKMSKSLGNVVSPDDVIKNYGADILRLWVAASDYSEDIRLSQDILKGLTEVYRKIRNTLRYILGNISDMAPQEKIADISRRRSIDRYIFYRAVITARLAEEAYKNFEFHKVVYHINNFCVNDLSSFYFDVLKDCLYTFKKTDPARRSAQSTLEDIFLILEKYISPILPFTAEEAWQSYRNDRNLSTEPVSLFDKDFSDVGFAGFLDKNFDEAAVLEMESWEKILEARRVVNVEIEKFRNSGEVGSSLECKVKLFYSDESAKVVFEKYLADLPSVFIVSSVELGGASSDGSLRAGVSKADGKKCARCWNWRKDVGADSEHPEICARCSDAISYKG